MAVAGLGLSGCQGQNAEAAIQAANVELDAGDSASAIVRLKAALQQKPNSAALARLLLGRAMLDNGDARSAVMELDKSLQAGQPPQQVLPLLGQAMVAAGEAPRFIAAHGRDAFPDNAAMAALKSTLAAAHLSLGQTSRAQQLVDEAAVLAPDHLSVRLMQARLLARDKNLPGALAVVDALVASDAGRDNSEAWRLQGDLRLVAGDSAPRAMASYKQALSVKKNDLNARASLVAVLIQTHALDEAARELQPLQALARDSVRTQLLQAQLAVERQDFKTARELSQTMLRSAPEQARVRELAGALDARSGALQQAEAHLHKAMRLDPDSAVARRLLAEIYLRSGQPQRALAAVQPLLDQSTPPAEALALAAEAQLMQGEAGLAEASYRQAAQQRPQDTRLRTGLAISRQAQGHSDEAVASLRTTAAADAGTAADLALIRLLSDRGDWTGTLVAIDMLQVKTPGRPLAGQLRGQTEWRRNNLAAARTGFEQALAADALYLPAVTGLVRLDLREGQAAQARERLQRFLKGEPTNLQALLLLAELQAQLGAPPDDVRRLLNQAIASHPEDAQSRVLLVNHHLAAKDGRGALAAAEQAVGALPDDLQVLDALGRTKLATGDGQQALSAFKKLAGAQPTSASPWLRMAEAHLLLKDHATAAGDLQRALALEPGSLGAQRGMILLALDRGLPQEALQLARQVQQQRPREAVGFVLEGDVAAAQRRWVQAAAAYRRALGAALGGGSGDVAIKLHTALLAGDGAVLKAPVANADSRQFVRSWLAEHPRDGQFLIHLGDQDMARGDLPAAEQQYQRAVASNPQDPFALNNLAWVMARQKKPGALAHAEKANGLLPNRPEMMDTLATSLAEAGQLQRALELQQKALALAPGNPLLKFNLAKLYLQSGEKNLARKELEQVARLGDRFRDQAAVQELLAAL